MGVKGAAYRGLSLWHETAGDDWKPRPSLPGDIGSDVAIVGAGFTGLWTAYWLTELDPSLDIVIIEREVAGFGASGRNGGWCSAIFPASLRRIAKDSGRAAAIRMQQAMNETVAAVGEITAREGIDCDFQQGGYLSVARNTAQLRRGVAEVQNWRDWGFGQDQIRLLSGGDVHELANVQGRSVQPSPHTAPRCIPPSWSVGLRGSSPRVGSASTSRPPPPRSGHGAW